MKVAQLHIENFQGVRSAKLDFDGHVLLVGQNNVGKSTICEALELALGPDRQERRPVAEEFDFYNAVYLDQDLEPVPIRIEVLLVDVTPSVERACWNHLDRWNLKERRILGEGELAEVDGQTLVWCLRLLTIARYDRDEDEFEAATHYARSYDLENERESRVPRGIRRTFGFLYLRALRTGSRALSLERGSLLDVILRLQTLHTGIWEQVRRRLEGLAPPIDEGISALEPVLRSIENRLAEYVPMANPGDSTRLFVSQLTREHLRKTLSFFLSLTADQKPVPFQKAGTGTLSALVLALLSFIADLKEENVIFAMEEPEIALPPHTQRRIANYLLTKTTQCFVTSHSPYVIECFNPEQILILRRDATGLVEGKKVALGVEVKAKTYRRHIRRAFGEAMLGKAVIIAEGVTEQAVLRVVAERLESEDQDKYPLDLSGVTILSADGDGSVAEFGRFFVSLDLPSFAFLDKKARPPKEKDALAGAGFVIVNETAYSGMEELLAAEVAIGTQWTYLDDLRIRGVASNVQLPATRPSDRAVRDLTVQALKAGKGSGRAAELIELCELSEIPSSVSTFLQQIYERFPRPKIPATAPVDTPQPIVTADVSDSESGTDAPSSGEE